MELEHIKKLQEALTGLQSQDNQNLSEHQKNLIMEAQVALNSAQEHSGKKRPDWNAIISLGLQAANLLVEMFKSG
ncbi:hypothetical protein DRW42_13125 [Pedobacter miscanthi]|uniref:Uncharacterized protein n=1 Tax=Pedobacter miscanthi TaxID=2259170 RepID=A0A366KYX6_9SPHI|nr:hypothetical protein DRW42_13125 [Pedobacter miscanthi]